MSHGKYHILLIHMHSSLVHLHALGSELLGILSHRLSMTAQIVNMCDVDLTDCAFKYGSVSFASVIYAYRPRMYLLYV